MPPPPTSPETKIWMHSIEAQSPWFSTEFLLVSEASCRVQNCPPDRCTGLQGCLTPTSPVPSPVEKREQVSLNWQPLTLQEARALLKQRRPRGPWARALLKRRPPHRAPAGQARGKNIRPSSA
ncbi:latent-transforming growth factor beta-binding protein 4 isoform X1 [Sigmodon hispidus]